MFFLRIAFIFCAVVMTMAFLADTALYLAAQHFGGVGLFLPAQMKFLGAPVSWIGVFLVGWLAAFLIGLLILKMFHIFPAA